MRAGPEGNSDLQRVSTRLLLDLPRTLSLAQAEPNRFLWVLPPFIFAGKVSEGLQGHAGPSGSVLQCSSLGWKLHRALLIGISFRGSRGQVGEAGGTSERQTRSACRTLPPAPQSLPRPSTVPGKRAPLVCAPGPAASLNPHKTLKGAIFMI